MLIKNCCIFILMFITIICLVSLSNSFDRRTRRSHIFKLAKMRSQQVGKKLLVIGDPDNGIMNKYFGRDYGCGDECIDLAGCSKCKSFTKGDVCKMIKLYPSDSHVIFISCVLEYIDSDKLEDLYDELLRVSGKDLFVVSVGAGSIESYFYIGPYITNEQPAKNLVYTEYPEIQLLYKKLK